MRQFFLVLSIAFLAISCKDTSGFKIHNGVNIAHWLSQSSARGKEIIRIASPVICSNDLSGSLTRQDIL